MPKEERVVRRSEFTPFGRKGLGSSPNEPAVPRRTSIFGRLTSAITGFIGSATKLAASVGSGADLGKETLLRDFPFRTASGTCFFSTRRSQSAQFGYHHSQRLQYNRGAYAGALTTVVGVRLGMLWLVDDDDEVAHPLPQLTKSDIDDAYGFTVEYDESVLSPAPIPTDLGEVELGFLRTAPDLLLKIEQSADSFSANGAQAVHLAPVYVQLNDTATLGWAGEGPVIITGGGVENAECSASASLVIPSRAELPGGQGQPVHEVRCGREDEDGSDTGENNAADANEADDEA